MAKKAVPCPRCGGETVPHCRKPRTKCQWRVCTRCRIYGDPKKKNDQGDPMWASAVTVPEVPKDPEHDVSGEGEPDAHG